MIFLTLGTQLPFDRLARAVDAAAADLDEEVFGQIGRTDFRPRNMDFTDVLTPTEAAARVAAARVIVGHAGIGTVLSAMRAGKPLVVMARKAALHEHRNDHQAATIVQLRRIPGIVVAETAEDVGAALADPDLPPIRTGASPSLARLIDTLRDEIAATSPRD